MAGNLRLTRLCKWAKFGGVTVASSYVYRIPFRHGPSHVRKPFGLFQEQSFSQNFHCQLTEFNSRFFFLPSFPADGIPYSAFADCRNSPAIVVIFNRSLSTGHVLLGAPSPLTSRRFHKWDIRQTSHSSAPCLFYPSSRMFLRKLLVAVDVSDQLGSSHDRTLTTAFSASWKYLVDSCEFSQVTYLRLLTKLHGYHHCGLYLHQPISSAVCPTDFKALESRSLFLIGRVLASFFFCLATDSLSPLSNSTSLIKCADDLIFIHHPRNVSDDYLQCEWDNCLTCFIHQCFKMHHLRPNFQPSQ